MSAIKKCAFARAAGISTSILFTLILNGCAHDELRQARYEATQANLRAADAAHEAAEAGHAATLSQKSAEDANFARFEAESRADQADRERRTAEARAKILEESRMKSMGGSYEHYEYLPGDGSYSESYESYQR